MTKKKKLGQFFTPPDIAKFMVEWALGRGATTVLDPAVGPGVFIKAVNNLKPQTDKYAYEVDDEMITCFKQGFQEDVHLVSGDYLKEFSDLKYDAIVCNPPYNKFQEIDDRKKLIEDFDRRYNIRLSGYTNYCIYFLIKSINELSDRGRCCYIIPYEFLNTGYGTVVKKYLIEKKILHSIIKFDSSISLFGDAITTSCILMLEKNNDEVRFVNISSLDEFYDFYSIQSFKEEMSYKYEELDPNKKWLQYFKRNSDSKYNNCVPFYVVAQVKRGIATGSNAFFTLDRQMIERNKLSNDVCIPCVTKAPDIKTLIFNKAEFDRMYRDNRKVYIFDGCNAKTTCDLDYIKQGENLGVNEGYLTSHRKPWYKLEEKEPSPIWISVFGRERFKVVRNEAGVKNLTTFHSIYVSDSYEKYTNALFCYLLTPIALEIINQNKREYGDGLDKFEPNDINQAQVFDFTRLTESDLSKINDCYNRLSNEVIMELDSIFRKYICE